MVWIDWKELDALDFDLLASFIMHVNHGESLAAGEIFVWILEIGNQPDESEMAGLLMRANQFSKLIKKTETYALLLLGLPMNLLRFQDEVKILFLLVLWIGWLDVIDFVPRHAAFPDYH